jgi:hypothetical protein
VSRIFFDQVDDELRGLLGPALRGYHGERNARLLKLWYTDPHAHFEVQILGARWAPGPGPALEIGLHLEHPDARANDRLLAVLKNQAPAWEKRLPGAVAGKAIGPRAGAWRRVSEFLEPASLGPEPLGPESLGPEPRGPADAEDPELASEAAERLAAYVRTLWPLLAGVVEPTGEAPREASGEVAADGDDEPGGPAIWSRQ